MVVIDQHALHERVLYERVCAKVLAEDSSLESQKLLVPEPVSLTPAERTAAKEPTIWPQGLKPTDWARPAPVGQDFPTLGSFSLTPAEIEDEARNKLASGGGVQNAELSTAVQINHIDSHFEPLRIDTSLEPPASVLDPLAFDPVTGGPEPINPLFYRLDPSVSNFFNVFDALEIWNCPSQGSQDKFLGRVMGIWMNHLNQGIAITATSVTASTPSRRALISSIPRPV